MIAGDGVIAVPISGNSGPMSRLLRSLTRKLSAGALLAACCTLGCGKSRGSPGANETGGVDHRGGAGNVTGGGGANAAGSGGAPGAGGADANADAASAGGSTGGA